MRWVRKLSWALGLDKVPKIRKVVVSVIGGTIVLVGIALIVLPGPGSLVIPLGLLVLASEFAWARYVLHRGKVVIARARRGRWRELFSPAPPEP
jgi:hypothetical protein